MNLRKGLIGLFVLSFLVSGIGLGLLVLDDQNDLSSRAATGVLGSLRPALPEEKMLQDGSVWEGGPSGLPLQVTFNKLLWMPPLEKETVFFHLLFPVTVRITQEKIDLVALKKILGESFTTPKPVGTAMSYLAGWQTKSYLFSFYGSPKFVDVWTNSSGVSLIAVMPGEDYRADVTDLARGISGLSQVKGISSPDDSARLAAIIRPSVVMILNNYCAQVNFTESAGPLLSGKAYPFCLAQAGSGFFVNKDGFIATNGHVVTNLPESSLIFGVLGGSLDNLLVDFFQVFLSSQSSFPIEKPLVEARVKEAHQNKETLYQMASVVNELLKKNFVKIENPVNQYFVQLGNTPIQLTKDGVKTGSDIVEATFVDSDYNLPDKVTGFSSSDVALIKVDGTNYPALPLGKTEEVSVGSNILVVGFPGIAMGSQSDLLDTSANAEPTFTGGVVSAFKQAKGDKKNLIQTDASINHGNSGGPAVSSKGNVIGIATYGLVPEEGSGNYNFLRDVADLQALMVKNKISEDVGNTYPTWKSGLENYWISYLKPAKIDFEKVVSLYPKHPTVNKYLTETDSKIGSSEDKTPRFSRIERRLYMNISGGVMAFSVVAIVVLSISGFIDSKRRSRPTILPPQPIQTF